MDIIDIRPLEAADLDALAEVVDATGLFPPEMLPDLTAGFLAGDGSDRWVTCTLKRVPVGLCYARPEDMADRVWNMLALAVAPRRQGQGLGGQLVRRLEDDLRASGQRLLIVDTSGTPDFARTRAFYQAHGYVERARIPDYWSEGDDKVTFAKRLQV